MKNIVLIKNSGRWGLDMARVKAIARRALEERGWKENTELSLVFVGRKTAKELNQKYRKMDYIPQVLGFPMSRTKDVDGRVRLGDVVVCTAKLRAETVVQKKGVYLVLNEWVRHGIDNLLK